MVRAIRGRCSWRFLSIASAALVVATLSLERVRAWQSGSGPAPGVYELVARHSGKCLDVAGASLAAGARSSSGAATAATISAGRSRLNGRLLSPDRATQRQGAGRHPARRLADAATIIQYTPHVGDNQQWRSSAVGDGYYRLIARHSGKALDVSGVSSGHGAGVIQCTATRGANQQWLLRRVSAAAHDAPATSPTSCAFSSRRRSARRQS